MNFCQCSGPTRRPSTYTQENFTSRYCQWCSRWLNPTESILGPNNRRLASLDEMLGTSAHE